MNPQCFQKGSVMNFTKHGNILKPLILAGLVSFSYMILGFEPKNKRLEVYLETPSVQVIQDFTDHMIDPTKESPLMNPIDNQ